MFKHIHMCSWHQHTIGCSSIMDLVVVLSDLRLHVLDTLMKKGVGVVHRPQPGGKLASMVG